LRTTPELFAEKEAAVTEETKTKSKPTQSVIELLEKRGQLSESPIFTPVDTKRHILKDIDLPQIIPYINMQMLIGHHLGLKGKIKELIQKKDPKTLELVELIQDLLKDGAKKQWFKPAAAYQFFPSYSEGNKLHILDPKNTNTILETFDFPRQEKLPYRCISDYIRPKQEDGFDYVAMFAVTAGSQIRELAQGFKEQGDYLKSHAVQALALELAEGLAERTHQLVRDRWGFPDAPDFTMDQRFSAKYQGQRFSFGYPACPDLEDQEKLFKLLKPEDIGIQLTEGFMMEPEASVTAIVVAHPDAKYFNVM
jgi:5-methyltetrahydrofolate--homocysteine methyltransferase